MTLPSWKWIRTASLADIVQVLAVLQDHHTFAVVLQWAAVSAGHILATVSPLIKATMQQQQQQ